MRRRVRNREYRAAESAMKKKQKVSSKFLVLALEPLSSHTEIAYNVGVMKRETPLVKSVSRFFFLFLYFSRIIQSLLLFMKKVWFFRWGYVFSFLKCASLFCLQIFFIFLNCLLRLCFFRVCFWSSDSYITILINNLAKRINNLVVFLTKF